MWPARELWESVGTLGGGLCLERDRFLRVLERDWERERDRRDLLERLGERFPVSAVGAGGGGVSVATGNGVNA